MSKDSHFYNSGDMVRTLEEIITLENLLELMTKILTELE